jgi:polysaccharide biosynthesis/export protein
MMRINLLPLIGLLLASHPSSGQETVSPFANRAPRYRLAPDDVINVQYRYTPEFNQSASVQPDGFVSLPIVGTLHVGGLNLEEARALVFKVASQRLQNPDVTVTLTEYQKPYFTVAGEVANPGRKELRGRVTAVEAIAMAGGLKPDRAKHSQVILFRRVDPEMAETKVLDLKSTMNPAHLGEDVELMPGDLLVVPQNLASKVERFVRWVNLGMYLNPKPF